MKPQFGHRKISGTQCGPESVTPPADQRISPGPGEFQACCCPAMPIIRVTMPATPSRSHPVDLLLCGHHYRISRAKLEAAGAKVEELPGRSANVAAALFQEVSETVAAGADGPGR
jgi:hypothetical protein